MEFEYFDERIDKNKVELLPGVEEFFKEADEIWLDNQKDFHFRNYVSADVERLYQALAMLTDQAETFLEWGSGLGIVASSAGLLGYQAYGIEIDPKLYRQSQVLADKYDTGAEFSCGSFVPDGYEIPDDHDYEFFRTILEERDGYGDLDMELRDFDLIYAYPWPGERQFFLDIVQACGREGALVMTYDVREGVQLERL